MTYNLFSVPLDIDKKALEHHLSMYANNVYVKFLNSDNQGRPVQFGRFVIDDWKDEKGFKFFCDKHKMTFKCLDQQNPPPHREQRSSEPQQREIVLSVTRGAKTFAGNFGMAYYRESQGYGQKNILDSSLPKQEICRSFPHSFKLKTLYPGLLIGSGYLHPVMTKASKESAGDFQLGFFFDHSTGLPVIPGSSIKGVLRSVFANPEIIQEYLKEIAPTLELELVNINLLKNAIFEGKIDSKPIGMYERDIFHDAFLVAGDDESGDKFLADDYITPHIDELSDPDPIRFIKIRSNVIFQFNFDLKETKIGATVITREMKKELFSKILLDFGMGAKTNVGYGHFIEVDK